MMLHRRGSRRLLPANAGHDELLLADERRPLLLGHIGERIVYSGILGWDAC